MIIGIDVGGTHTDAVLIDQCKIIKKAKVPTVADNLLHSLLQVTEILLADENPNQLERVVLSTTISTNAIVQKKTDKVGMILANGPGLAPAQLTIGEHCYFTGGYIDHRGIEASKVEDNDILRIKNNLQAEDIRHVGIVGKFSTRNPAQEFQIGTLLLDAIDHLSLGHRMSGHLNFPRRVATTYLNASIARLYNRFVEDLLVFAKRQKITAPIYILKADGGTFEIRRSIEFPVQTILSGPAASIMGVLSMTRDKEDAIALDIGGTTTDIAILAGGVPLLETFGVTIGGYKTLIRGLRTTSIGLGGDSCVRWDDGRLFVGPYREGPAAAFGGLCPTLTDAMIILGLTDIGQRHMAEQAMLSIAEGMHCSLVNAAQQVFEQACHTIVDQVNHVIEEINNQPVYTIHEMLEGKSIQPKILHVVGGPAAPMASRLGQLLGCRVHIPEHPEVANAIGAALARTTAEMTMLADTEQRTLSIAEEGFRTAIPKNFSKEDALRIAHEKLKEKALQMGAREDDLEMEVVENQEFNMVKQFSTTGRNIRIKLQIKPGLISRIQTDGLP